MSICDGSTGASLLVQYSDNPDLAYNDGGHTWVDVRNVVGKLNHSGGDKTADGYRTFNGIETGLSQAALKNLGLDVVFKNSTTSFLEFLTDTYDGTEGVCFWLRWAANNGATGALRWTAKISLLTNPFPDFDAASGAAVVKSLNFVIDDGIYRDTVP